MPGIAGIHHFGPADESDVARRVQSMLIAIDPRHADATDAVAFEGGALGHATLPSPLHTPEVAVDGEIVAAVDGVVFGDGDRSAARRAIDAYRAHGSACLRHLRGLFSVIVVDRARGRVVFGTDWLGHRPLFYRIDGDSIAIASEARALVHPFGPPADIDLESVADFLTMGMPFGEDTLFNGVCAVPGGTMVEVRPGRAKVTQYWRLDYGDADAKRDVDEAAEELADLASKAVASCVRGAPVVDVPLDGDLGTRLVVAALHAQSVPMRLYASGGADDAIAQRIADTLGLGIDPTGDAPLPPDQWLLEGVGLTDGVFPALAADVLDLAHRLPPTASLLVDGTHCLGGQHVRFGRPRALAAAHYAPRTRIVQRICDDPLFDGRGVLADGGWFTDAFRRVARNRLATRLAWLGAELFPGYTSGYDVLDHLHHTHRTRGSEALRLRLLERRAVAVAPLSHPSIVAFAQRLPSVHRGEDQPVVARAIARLAPAIARIPVARTGQPPIANRVQRVLRTRAVRPPKGGAVPMSLANPAVRAFLADTLRSRECRERGIFDPAFLARVAERLEAGHAVAAAPLGRAIAVELFHRQHAAHRADRAPHAPTFAATARD